MTRITFIFSALIALICFAQPSWLLAGGGHDHGSAHSEDGHDEPIKGPMGGRLLTDDHFALEVTIFERGVPPEFRLFAYDHGKPINPADVQVKVELRRFGNRVDKFEFSPLGQYLGSPSEVVEPHSFDVHVSAIYKGKAYSWRYESYEGRTKLSKQALKRAGIEIESAGSRRLEENVTIYGELIPNEDRVAHISARFPGIIKEIKKKLGDPVKKDEVLAIIESNQNLQPYEVRSQISGLVIQRHASLGEFVSDTNEILIVADLSELLADFQIYRDDFGRAAIGQKVIVSIGNEGQKISSTVSYVSPVTDQQTQSKRVRAIIPNQDLSLRPGLFIEGSLTVAEVDVPVAVKRTALQTFRDWNVVFLADKGIFQATPVELGKQDSEFVEILSGVTAGQSYVSDKSFIIKADIEKSGAAHDH